MLEFNTGGFNLLAEDEGYIDVSVRMSAETNLYSQMITGLGQADQGFNTELFNHPDQEYTRYVMNFSLEFNVDSVMSGVSGNVGEISFDVFLNSVGMHGLADMSTRYIREMNVSSIISGQSDMSVTPAYYQQSYLQLDGSFAPGDRIVIDSSRLIVTQNGNNALHLMNGEFFDLNLGPNSIVYSDDAAGRNMLIRITHRDRFI
ncbi:hypothetical protein QE450_000854 [Paenibacillus sp. SORGH_AS306]|uniref:phage distal tail protein n=1 Tax=unclassified Paenibacillus TaxID=185978 RepID=UPI002781D4C4|nr:MULTISPECIES: phage tail domain-containing protein [unclassified Paenibacillus]MDQ1233356.1 hypothetical protein [Paenibacillus sp. SORGH_AS_0306]MDR6110397.1 hypothetical protein [Paenibacillus sp. SORGH_AS_0338]